MTTLTRTLIFAAVCAVSVALWVLLLITLLNLGWLVSILL